jgi:amino acid adenylation domain-containing protein
MHMIDAGLPEPQQAVRIKCRHPTGSFLEFDQEAITGSIPNRFEQQVRRHGDRIALVVEKRRLSYPALDDLANRVAAAIIASRTPKDTPVAILIEQGPDFIAAMLGVLKAGHFYVPLDPAYPLSRLAFMLEDSQAALLVTNTRYVRFAKTLVRAESRLLTIDRLPVNPAPNDVACSIDPDELACLIYTSGSTGQPKGVMHTHRTLLHMTMVATNALRICAEDRLVLLYSPSFLAATRAVCLALCNGATLFPFKLTEEGLAHFATWLTGNGITVYYSIPTVFRHFMRTLPDKMTLPSVRLVWLSGESIEHRDVASFRRHFAEHCVLVPFFGAAEMPGPVLLHCVDKQIRLPVNSLPLGYAVQGSEVLLCDESGREVADNHVGEIAVKSRYLALGYWRRPELTQAVFRPDPCGTEARVYYTGDLGRRLSDGAVEFLGRKDWQLKIRGFRIEPGEVERVLLEMPAVAEAVVVPWERQDRDARLVAYVVPAQEGGVMADRMRRFLRARLPQHMVPSAFVVLPALPRTPSGKIDRRALPDPELSMSLPDASFVPPRSPLEREVAASWSDLLDLRRPGAHDNFFSSGGDSLLAMTLLSRLSDAMGVEVSLLGFLETPTIAGLAHQIETALQERPRQLPSLITRVPRDAPLPASLAQEEIWIVDRVFQELALFNTVYAVRVRGLRNIDVLQQSCDEIIRRHEALRTSFAAVEGRLTLVIAPTVNLPVTIVDLRAVPDVERRSEARRLASVEARQPFDLEVPPLLRLHLLRMDDEEYFLLVTMHHIVGDGWSLGLFAHELAVLYEAFSASEPSPLPDPRIQFADFAHWQRQWPNDGAMSAQLAYWQERLADPLPVLDLPTDHPRGGAVSFRAARQALVLPDRLTEALIGLGRRDGGTLFPTMLAAFKMLLFGYTGQEDLCVATHTANRSRRATEDAIGLFVNTVILRTDLRGDPTCQEVLHRVRATALAAYANQDLSFEALAQTFERERGVTPASLCQVMMVMQDAIERPLQRPARTLSLLEVDLDVPAPPLMVNAFDLVLFLRERQEGLIVSAIYKQSLFADTTIQRLLADFEHVLECLVAEPEQRLSSFRSLAPDRRRASQ